MFPGGGIYELNDEIVHLDLESRSSHDFLEEMVLSSKYTTFDDNAGFAIQKRRIQPHN